MKRELATVSEDEKMEIQKIYNHLSALKELEYLISPEDKPTYNRFVADKQKTNEEYQNWWMKISLDYSLPESKDGKWEFNFKTNKIYLT